MPPPAQVSHSCQGQWAGDPRTLSNTPFSLPQQCTRCSETDP